MKEAKKHKYSKMVEEWETRAEEFQKNKEVLFVLIGVVTSILGVFWNSIFIMFIGALLVIMGIGFLAGEKESVKKFLEKK